MSDTDLTVPFSDLVETAYEATNRGTETGGTTVELVIDSETTDSESITVARHDSEAGELVWDTDGVLPGTYKATISTAYTTVTRHVEIEPPEIDYEFEFEEAESSEDFGPEQSDNPIRVTLTNSLGWPVEGERVYLELTDWRGIPHEVVESDGVTDENGEVYLESFNPEAMLTVVRESTGTLYWTGGDSDSTRYASTDLYPNISASGGEVTTVEADDGIHTVHSFTDVGDHTFTVDEAMGERPIDVLVVGGGAGAGNRLGGAGGGGGIVFERVNVSEGTYEMTVGDGGVGNDNETTGESGEDSVAFGLTALGGGGGAGNTGGPGLDGGSGGGGANSDAGDASSSEQPGGDGIQPVATDGGYGNDGGDGNSTSDIYGGGGGGGAGEAGDTAQSNERGGDGGDGLGFAHVFSDQFGDDGWFAGGGGGSSYNWEESDGRIALGGKGGGGDGCRHNTDVIVEAEPGMENTGGGAGAGGHYEEVDESEDGGSGIVLIRYSQFMVPPPKPEPEEPN